jgi:hypothetical protein
LLQRCSLFSKQDDRRVGIDDGQGGSSTATAHREREDGVRPRGRAFLRSVHCWSGDWYLHRPAPGIYQSALFFAGYIHSQKAILKFKSAKINCFLRFSIVIIRPSFQEKNSRFLLLFKYVVRNHRNFFKYFQI